MEVVDPTASKTTRNMPPLGWGVGDDGSVLEAAILVLELITMGRELNVAGLKSKVVGLYC